MKAFALIGTILSIGSSVFAQGEFRKVCGTASFDRQGVSLLDRNINVRYPLIFPRKKEMHSKYCSPKRR